MKEKNITDIVRQAGQWAGQGPSTEALVNALPSELSSTWLFGIIDHIEEAVENLEGFRHKPLCELERTVDRAHGTMLHNMQALKYIADKLQDAENLLPEEGLKP